MPLEKFPGWSLNIANELFTRTKGSGAEVIKKKGGAGFAVGMAIQDVIEAIALDRRLPVCRFRACKTAATASATWRISVPTVVGRNGVVATHEIELWPKEVQGLRQSAQVLRQTIDTVLARVGKAKLTVRPAMQKSLDRKLAAIHADPSGAKDFILADAKDADMAFGIGAPGQSPETHAGEVRFRTLAEYREQIRQIVGKGWSTSC